MVGSRWIWEYYTLRKKYQFVIALSMSSEHG